MRTNYNHMTLGRQAKELGFARNTFEKVCRLAEIPAFIKEESKE